MGKRNLFVSNGGGIREIQPVCVLDFYVHESMQRGGHGKDLFDFMLYSEK
jgi:alpha-tubulin N-acetyltransferase 1